MDEIPHVSVSHGGIAVVLTQDRTGDDAQRASREVRDRQALSN